MKALGYPKWVWLTPIVLAAVVWIPVMEWALYCGVILIAVTAPVVRHRALHPLGNADRRYYQWLTTTPYVPDKPLPNGNIYPNLRDLLFLLLICLPLLPLLKYSILIFIWGIILTISLTLFVFCYSIARQLINLGPRWLGFAVLALWILALRIDWFLIEQVGEGIAPARSVLLQTLPPLVPFAVAVYGLHVIMRRYPWTGENLNSQGTYRGMSLREIQYSYGDVFSTGQPYTFLSPRGHWPRISWSDSLLMSLLPALGMPFNLGNESSAFLYSFAAAGALFGRIALYFSPVLPSPFSGGLILSWRNGSLWKNAVFTVLVLALLIVVASIVIRTAPASAAGPLALILTFATFLAAFKFPPTRAEWETSGRWMLMINGPDQQRRSEKRN